MIPKYYKLTKGTYLFLWALLEHEYIRSFNVGDALCDAFDLLDSNAYNLVERGDITLCPGYYYSSGEPSYFYAVSIIALQLLVKWLVHSETCCLKQAKHRCFISTMEVYCR
jgi:hypothetical protein